MRAPTAVAWMSRLSVVHELEDLAQGETYEEHHPPQKNSPRLKMPESPDMNAIEGHAVLEDIRMYNNIYQKVYKKFI